MFRSEPQVGASTGYYDPNGTNINAPLNNFVADVSLISTVHMHLYSYTYNSITAPKKKTKRKDPVD